MDRINPLQFTPPQIPPEHRKPPSSDFSQSDAGRPETTRATVGLNVAIDLENYRK